MKRESLNRALKTIRLFHRYSRPKLAEALGTERSVISAIELGKRNVTVDWVEKYANVFNIPQADIFLLAEAYDRRIYRRSPTDKILALFEWMASDDTDIAEEISIDATADQANKVSKKTSKKHNILVEEM